MTITEEKTDEALYAQYLNGDASAFEELYRRYFGRMLTIANKRLQNAQSSQEAVQNAFQRIHSWRHKYNSKYQVSQWFFVILRSEIHRLYKSSSKTLFEEKPLNLLTLSQNSAEESIDFKRQLEQMEESLSPEDMDLLRMRYVDGLAFEEIAEELGVNAVNLRQKLSRLVRRLKTRWL